MLCQVAVRNRMTRSTMTTSPGNPHAALGLCPRTCSSPAPSDGTPTCWRTTRYSSPATPRQALLGDLLLPCNAVDGEPRCCGCSQALHTCLPAIKKGCQCRACVWPSEVVCALATSGLTRSVYHRQVKAHLRGEPPPLSAQQLDVVLDVANAASRELLGMPLPQHCCLRRMACACAVHTLHHLDADVPTMLMTTRRMLQVRSVPQKPIGWHSILQRRCLPQAGLASWCAGCGRRQVQCRTDTWQADLQASCWVLSGAHRCGLWPLSSKKLPCCGPSSLTCWPCICRNGQGHLGHWHRSDGAHQPPGVRWRARAPVGAVCGHCCWSISAGRVAFSVRCACCGQHLPAPAGFHDSPCITARARIVEHIGV